MSQVNLNSAVQPLHSESQEITASRSSAAPSAPESDPALAHASPAPQQEHRVRQMEQTFPKADEVLCNARPAGAEPEPGVNENESAKFLFEDETCPAAIANAEEILETVFDGLKKADAKEIERREKIINKALDKLPDDAPQALFSGLATALSHLGALSMGRSILADMQAKNNELKNAAPHERPAMLEEMQGLWQALEMAEQGLAREENKASAAVVLFCEDIASCREAMRSMIALAMEGLIPQDTNEIVRHGLMSDAVCDALATLKLTTGAPLSSIASPIAQAMSAAQTVLNQRDMELSLPAILDALAADTSPQNVNAMADYLFMDSYPGTMDAALLLKKALVPQNPQALQGVKLLHTLGAARRAIFQKLFAEGVQNPETSSSVHGFDLTLEQMKKLAGREGVRDMGYQIANLIALEVKACRSGLLDNVLLHLNKGKTEDDLPLLREKAAADTMRKSALMEELGVARIVQSLTAIDPASSSADDIELAMIEAARRFAMGLMGLTSEEKIGKAVAKSAKAMQSAANAGAREGFFLQGAQAKAADFLDSLTVRITGVIDPDKRPVSGDPDGTKRKQMDGAMRMIYGPMFMQMSSVSKRLLTGTGDNDLAKDQAFLAEKLKQFGIKRSQIDQSILAMLRLSPLEDRREALRVRLAALRERSSSSLISSMKTAAKALGKAPSRKAEAERATCAGYSIYRSALTRLLKSLPRRMNRTLGACRN